MNKEMKIYKVQLYDGTDNNHYYAVSDINAIFERKFNYDIKNVLLISNTFIGSCNDIEKNKKLYRISISNNKTYFIVATDIKEAYKSAYVSIGGDIVYLNSIEYIAPIKYIKSFVEIDNEVEDMRIG